MIRPNGGWLCCVSMAVAAFALPPAVLAHSAAVQNKKPSIKVKANPTIGMPPFRVVVTAEVTGGSNDFEEFYCPSVEWDWGDGTTSTSTADCDPYEAGKSEIKRRYVQEHTYQSTGIGRTTYSSPDASDMSGNQQPVQLRIRFVLKQKNKTVGAGQTTIQVRPSFRDGGMN
jgi:hypothetical protein